MLMHEGPADELATVEAVAKLLRSARRPLFITGAGISADSGLPTYRGIGGLYHARLTDEGFAIEEALSARVLASHPHVTWKYLMEIERTCRNAGPNAAHRVLAALEGKIPEGWLLTQNIDGLHRAAGSHKLTEIHGTLHHLHCTACDWKQECDSFADLPELPLCPECGALVRPDVVLFGEALPEQALLQLQQVLDEGVDMVFSIGTTSAFQYIAGPFVWASQVGIPTVEINPGETVVSDFASHAIRLGAAAALQAIWHEAFPHDSLP